MENFADIGLLVIYIIQYGLLISLIGNSSSLKPGVECLIRRAPKVTTKATEKITQTITETITNAISKTKAQRWVMLFAVIMIILHILKIFFFTSSIENFSDYQKLPSFGDLQDLDNEENIGGFRHQLRQFNSYLD